MFKDHLKKHKAMYLTVLVLALFATAAVLFSRAGVIDLGPLLKGDIGYYMKKSNVGKAKMPIPLKEKMPLPLREKMPTPDTTPLPLEPTMLSPEKKSEPAPILNDGGTMDPLLKKAEPVDYEK